jgi:hypothetical protein
MTPAPVSKLPNQFDAPVLVKGFTKYLPRGDLPFLRNLIFDFNGILVMKILKIL